MQMWGCPEGYSGQHLNIFTWSRYIANYTTYPTPNQAAIDTGLIDAEMLENEGIYPDEESLERLFYILTPPDAEQLYTDAWDEVKIAISR